MNPGWATLAGETALAAGNHEWLKKSATRIRNLAAKLPAVAHNGTLRLRLRILAACPFRVKVAIAGSRDLWVSG
jgi:hypothetical protein